MIVNIFHFEILSFINKLKIYILSLLIWILATVILPLFNQSFLWLVNFLIPWFLLHMKMIVK